LTANDCFQEFARVSLAGQGLTFVSQNSPLNKLAFHSTL
jgi:hypothetical protein